jgi:hypothetical protein
MIDITKFLADNLPPDEELAGYVICLAKRDKTYVVAQGYDSPEIRDKVSKKLIEEMTSWPGPQ